MKNRAGTRRCGRVRPPLFVPAKKLIASLAAIAALAAVVLWRRGGPPDYVNFPPPARGPWIALGDSLTEGHGASSGHDYPALLSRRLGLPIHNAGISGDTTADGLRRVEEIAARRPRVVLLCLGGNDVLNQEPREKMLANLAVLIDRLHRAGTFVVLIGVRSAGLRDKNEEHFARLARAKRVFLVPNILKGIFPKPVFMSDAVHPNDEGYRRIAERMEKELRPLLEKLRGPP